MKPYYEDERAGIVIYHGDCRDVVTRLDGAFSVMTDPPYGMDYEARRGSDGSKRWGDERVVGDDGSFDPAFLLGNRLLFRSLILWGANWYADRLPSSGGWLVWDKTPKGSKDGFTASHAELAWTNLCSSIRKFSLQWGGEARNGEPFYHPTQKPVALASWMLREFPTDAVLDPYMGAGSPRRAETPPCRSSESRSKNVTAR